MRLQKILCPTDFSEASYAALKKAVDLAGNGSAEICVIHVEQPDTELSSIVDLAPNAHSEAQRRAEAVTNLCAVLEELVPASVGARPLLKCGDPAREILNAAREEGADLIVLTTHGAGSTQPSALGRVAQEVLVAAQCPVLTLGGRANRGMGEARYAANGSYSNGNTHHSYDSMPAAIATISSKSIFLDGD